MVSKCSSLSIGTCVYRNMHLSEHAFIMPLTESRAFMKRTTLLNVSNFTQWKRVAIFLPRNLALYLLNMYWSYNLPSSYDPEAGFFSWGEEESQKILIAKFPSSKTKPDFVSEGFPGIIIKLQGSCQTNGIVSLQLISSRQLQSKVGWKRSEPDELQCISWPSDQFILVEWLYRVSAFLFFLSAMLKTLQRFDSMKRCSCSFLETLKNASVSVADSLVTGSKVISVPQLMDSPAEERGVNAL